jgi:hypothetical protein
VIEPSPGALIEGVVDDIGDVLTNALPTVLLLAGSLLGLFVAWRVLRRFVGR